MFSGLPTVAVWHPNNLVHMYTCAFKKFPPGSVVLCSKVTGFTSCGERSYMVAVHVFTSLHGNLATTNYLLHVLLARKVRSITLWLPIKRFQRNATLSSLQVPIVHLPAKFRNYKVMSCAKYNYSLFVVNSSVYLFHISAGANSRGISVAKGADEWAVEKKRTFVLCISLARIT